MAAVTYMGYSLVERPQGGWRSIIDGEVLTFDTAGQWKKYIDYKKYGKTEESGHRN